MGRGVTFCRTCRRHFDAERRHCPVDGSRLHPPATEMPAFGAVIDGRYLVMERIGAGGMGSVFRAFDTASHLEVALKVISPLMAARADGVGRFFREVRAVERLSHPNVVTVHGFGRTEDGLLYLVMELLHGDCLSELLQREGRLPVARALGIAEQVAGALDGAHLHGVIHRDLKPENFRLLPGNLLKILDFGIAALTDAPRAEPESDGTTVCGTPAYMSPEHALGLRCEPRSDLYGLGVLLFELLTGRTPYTGSEPLAIVKAHLLEPIPSARAVAQDACIPEGVDLLLQSLLAKSASERPADARTVRATLRGLRQALPVEVAAPLPAKDGVPFHERPTLMLEDGAMPDRTTLPDIAMHDSPTRVLTAPHIRMCRACGALTGSADLAGGPTAACTRCGAPPPRPGRAPSARAAEILRATVGADPRFATALQAPAEPTDEPPVRRRLALVHAWLRPLRDDADAFRSELEPVIEAWREEVARLGGIVCHDSGSVLRALFGIEAAAGPGTPPPSRGAVAAAAVLRLAVRRARREDKVPFQLRVGIATAHVFLEPAALVSPDQAIRGSSVDLASRLSRLASDGTVLLDAETATSVGSVARCKRVGHIGVRGQTVPHPVFALLTGAGAPEPRVPTANRATAPTAKAEAPAPTSAVG